MKARSLWRALALAAVVALTAGACTAADLGTAVNQPPVPPTTAVQISTTGSHTCALLVDGSIGCWGDNTFGQLGQTGYAGVGYPVLVPGVTAATQVAAGGPRSCAVLADTTVQCWSTWLQPAYVPSGDTHYAIQGLTGAVEVSMGSRHSCALLGDGTVECWGVNADGQLGTGDTTNSDTPVAVAGLSNVVALDLMNNRSCAVVAAGDVLCWGDNDDGLMIDGGPADVLVPTQVAGLAGATTISITGPLCATVNDGTAWCWGDNGNGELGRGTTGGSSVVPAPVSGLNDVQLVEAGGRHACAIRTGGAMVCWGDGSDGELGNGAFSDSDVPVPVAGMVAAEMAIGHNRSCAISVAGATYCWGDNFQGYAGIGISSGALNVPTGVFNLS